MAKFHYQVSDAEFVIQIEALQIEPGPKGEQVGYQVIIGHKRYHVVLQKRDNHTLAFSVDGEHKQLHLAAGSGPESGVNKRSLWFDGHTWEVMKVDPRRRGQQRSVQQESGALTASMPGQVREVLVAEGQAVRRGDPLVILEAMKMEMRISATEDGVVMALNCAAGDVVERGQTLVVLGQKK